MKHPTTIIFGIDSKKISHFTSIRLKQKINEHHRFEISVPHATVESPLAYTLENAQVWLGKVVHIKLEDKNNFLGVVTNVAFKQKKGHSGNQIIVSGYSKTILLESGKKLYSWEELSLKEIVKEVLKNGAGEQLQNEINPEYASKMEYQNQYLETDFEFIQRLAKQFNEWLYYNGEQLIFGKPQSFDDPIILTYNRDISKLKIAVKAVPNKFSAFTYNESVDKRYTANSNDTVAGLPKLGNEAFTASKAVFATPAYTHGVVSTGDDLVLESFLKKKQESAASGTNYIKASTRNPKLKIGSIVNIQSDILENKVRITQEVGTYIITKINHYATDSGEYENTFQAIPSKVLGLPEPDIDYPIAQTQQAVVVSSTDPKNKGRIKVQMLWQQGTPMQTAWLRVMTPDAGSSDTVSNNRGMVFIPEVGDHVMVHFRYGDPNRPFVLGSVFHGKSGGGGGDKNSGKSLKSKSGNNITLDDAMGQGGVLINDAIGNSLTFDGSGNTVAQAGDTNVVNVGKGSESHFKMDKEGNIILEGKNSFKVTVGASSLELLADGNIKINGKIFNLTAKNSMDISSPKNHIDGETKFDGGDVFIN
ncbi:phage baseplate assembly protein V [Flavobacterium sp. LS1R47]|uniref:Phage baseplate assembly protein V n=1 Tax=Flavobacterium frigoritolerans TaxID=2987686 RepID=A0A9X3C9H9_9FLAO|nr:phage baseplate assembly protein V [Flavobacterium frigoritolerans]MCV9934084.1 phage baseplate assembly protein V [Flavobacterium frigoritolerans]